MELFQSGLSPNKLYDCLAADIPVVTNLRGDVAETVRHLNAGLSVPSNSPTELATAITRIAHGGHQFAPGSAYVREQHDRARLAVRLAAVINGAQRSGR